MRLVGTLLALALGVSPALSADLFPDGKAVSYTQGDVLGADTTSGGYPIYRGDGAWRIWEVNSAMSGARGNADAIKRGAAVFLHIEPNGELFAVMSIVTNLTSTGQNQYLSGNPCGGSHLLSNNKGAGLEDNCMKVDPVSMKSSNGDLTLLSVTVIQSRSAGRSYFTEVQLNPELLGFRGTGVADWSADAVKASPEKSALVARIGTWAGVLQDASFRALEFNKPQEAFNNVPSFRTLIAAQ